MLTNDAQTSTHVIPFAPLLRPLSIPPAASKRTAKRSEHHKQSTKKRKGEQQGAQGVGRHDSLFASISSQFVAY